MKIAYIIGPYRAKTISQLRENIQRAEKIAIKYWQLGYAVICPHNNSAYFDGSCEDSIFLDGYLEILKRCDVCVLVAGWESSIGSLAEFKVAKNMGKIIIYPDENLITCPNCGHEFDPKAENCRN